MAAGAAGGPVVVYREEFEGLTGVPESLLSSKLFRAAIFRGRLDWFASVLRDCASPRELGLSERGHPSLSALTESRFRERNVDGWIESIENPKGDTALA